jgi:hypothetical protein
MSLFQNHATLRQGKKTLVNNLVIYGQLQKIRLQRHIFPASGDHSASWVLFMQIATSFQIWKVCIYITRDLPRVGIRLLATEIRRKNMKLLLVPRMTHLQGQSVNSPILADLPLMNGCVQWACVRLQTEYVREAPCETQL